MDEEWLEKFRKPWTYKIDPMLMELPADKMNMSGNVKYEEFKWIF